MTFNFTSRSSSGTLCWQECKGESLEVEIERQTVKGGRPPSTQQWPGARNCVYHVRKWRRFEEDLIGGCRRGRRVHGDHGAARRGGGGSILARHRTSEGVDGANRYCATPILVPNRNRNLRHGSVAVSQLCNSWIIYSFQLLHCTAHPLSFLLLPPCLRLLPFVRASHHRSERPAEYSISNLCFSAGRVVVRPPGRPQ